MTTPGGAPSPPQNGASPATWFASKKARTVNIRRVFPYGVGVAYVPYVMPHFAWDQNYSNRPLGPQSETRMRIAGRGGDVSFAVQEVDLAVREHGGSDDAGIVMVLKLIERAAAEVDRWSVMLGAQHVCDPWLDSCAQWVNGVGSTLVSAFSYDEGPERQTALALAAEESSMRLLMGVEREGNETVAVLRNLDGNAARAASELVARIDLADRILRARLAG